ncbi:PREDICTED: hemicentin-1-like [Poecilia mexicana]|uniref:Ig-like domain-containing protein n=2 Tax=Poecilia mexicana TaxID=48701 RepID=A0A3B3X409_9TELE|nr:PREDICTED: hemicentin-1-like [Poecilia mexicana]
MSSHPPVSQSGMLPLVMLGLLLLSLLSCGADLTCPPTTILTLDAPVIIENGTQLYASCNTTEEDFEELSLCLGKACCENTQKDGVVSCVARVSDFEMRAECKMKLNETHECSEGREITVYKIPEVMLSVRNGNATQSDYELQCDVFDVAPAQNISVTWYRNNKTFESFMNSIEGPEKTSYLLGVNISREEKFAEFRCEVQLKFEELKPQHPVISTTHHLSARYSPGLRTNSSNKTITVAMGGNATLLCDIEGNPPPVYQWTVDEQPMLETTNRLHITQVNRSSIYSCTATNILGNTAMHIVVDMEENDTTTDPPAMPTPEAPENCGLTVTPAEVYVKYGDSASINCSTTIKDAAIMNWEFAVGETSGASPPHVTWMIEKLEDFTVEPFCFVTLDTNEQCKMKPNITLYKLPDSVVVSAVGNRPMKEGEEHQLKCHIYNVAPAKKLSVKWYKDDETVFTDDLQSSDLTPLPECLIDSTVRLCNVSSIYTFTVKKSDNGSPFRCEAEFQFGPGGPLVPPSMASEPYTAVVHYKPTIKNCPSYYAGVENSFRLNDLPCETDGNPPPTVEWYYNGTLIDSFKLLTRAESGIYTATAHNSMGQVNIDVHITVEYAPRFSCQMLYEVEVKDMLKPLCKPEGLPLPNITWFKNGKEHFSQRWEKHESGNYSVKASNKHGTAEHTFYLDILYPPEFTQADTTTVAVVDGNVSLVWEADGNPKPEIQCNDSLAENVRASTVGRQRIITVTRATSTNAGRYICVATNKVGKVTRATTLVLQDKSTDLLQYWWVLLLALPAVVVLVFVFILKGRKKHGRYNFPLQVRYTVENGTT